MGGSFGNLSYMEVESIGRTSGNILKILNTFANREEGASPTIKLLSYMEVESIGRTSGRGHEDERPRMNEATRINGR